jgi:hypothetical protein
MDSRSFLDIVKHIFPAGFLRLKGGFSDGLGVCPDSVGTCAVTAVERADGSSYEKVSLGTL